MHKIALRFFLPLSILALLIMSSCNKDSILGLDIQPPNDRINLYSDTNSLVRAYTIFEDSLASDERTVCLFGSYTDPVFGQAKAGFFTEYRLASNNIDFGEDAIIDSIVFDLAISGYYGDTLSTHALRIYELSDTLSVDSTYYSNINVSDYCDKSSLIAEEEFSFNYNVDSIRIHLDNSFGQKLLEADSVTLSANDEFNKIFKGLYVETDQIQDGGSIVYFDLLTTNSRISIYYSNSDEDSLSYEFNINDKAARVNIFEHNYDNIDFAEQINDTVNLADKNYLQSMSGLKNILRFELSDTLKAKSEKGIVINKAELIIPVAEDLTMERYAKPASLYMTIINEDLSNSFIPDYIAGSDYFGGNYNSALNAYTFNIARYIQSLIELDPEKQENTRGLYLMISGSRISATRVICNGSMTENPIRIEITYSTI